MFSYMNDWYNQIAVVCMFQCENLHSLWKILYYCKKQLKYYIKGLIKDTLPQESAERKIKIVKLDD